MEIINTKKKLIYRWNLKEMEIQEKAQKNKSKDWGSNWKK
jgi:hypothetical protein